MPVASGQPEGTSNVPVAGGQPEGTSKKYIEKKMTDKYELPESLKSATKDQWRALVEKSLNGKSIEKSAHS